MSSRPGWLLLPNSTPGVGVMVNEPHSQMPCRRAVTGTEVSGDASLRGRGRRVVLAAEPSGTQTGRTSHADDEGDEWFRQGSGAARAGLRAGSHQELGTVLAWELAPRPTSVEQARLALQRSRLAWWLAMSLVAWLLARSGSSCLARGLQNLNFGNMGRPE